MNPTAHTLILSNTTLKYWSYHDTNKPTILIVHGFRGTHHGLEYIGKYLENYHIIVPDLPGFGDSPAFKDKPHTIENYASLMNEFIKKLQLDQPILLGHSMGTVIIADMLRQDPSVTRKAVMINPVSEQPSVVKLFPGYLYHRLAGRYLPQSIGTKVLQNRWLFLLGSSVMTKTKDKQLRKLIHWNHITYMKRFDNRASLLEAFESANGSALSHYTDSLTIPMLLIAGKQDSIAPIAGQRRLVNVLPSAKLIELDNVGHIIHYEQPKVAAEAIVEFLNS